MSTLDSPSPSAGIASDAVLQVIQEAVNKMTGKSVPITRETRMDRYFIEMAGADSLEYLDLSFRLEKRLGIKLSNEDWAFLSGGTPAMRKDEWEAKYAEFFTFGRLADLVASRARLGQVQPLTILGAASISAGAFRAIERIAMTIIPGVEPFAPSTPILDRITGKNLITLWARVRILSGNRVPLLHKTKPIRVLEAISRLLGRILVISLTVGVCGAGVTAFFGVDSIVGALGVLSGSYAVCFAIFMVGLGSAILLLHQVVRILEPREAILPQDIRTFRDLAELISGDRGGWCEKCGYDLTGLTSAVCPECGTPYFRSQLQVSPPNN